MPGTGVADDKVIYAYVPQMSSTISAKIRSFECSDLPCDNPADIMSATTWSTWWSFTNESGAGIAVGRTSQGERDAYREQIKLNPRNYIAQPTLRLSRVPTLCNDQFEGRHVDLRPYALFGKEQYVLPGALTRVALKKGSLVVNSSQGGGSKDTWVLAE